MQVLVKKSAISVARVLAPFFKKLGKMKTEIRNKVPDVLLLPQGARKQLAAVMILIN